MRPRDWALALAGMAVLMALYADRQHADADSACRDAAALLRAGG